MDELDEERSTAQMMATAGAAAAALAGFALGFSRKRGATPAASGSDGDRGPASLVGRATTQAEPGAGDRLHKGGDASELLPLDLASLSPAQATAARAAAAAVAGAKRVLGVVGVSGGEPPDPKQGTVEDATQAPQDIAREVERPSVHPRHHSSSRAEGSDGPVPVESAKGPDAVMVEGVKDVGDQIREAATGAAERVQQVVEDTKDKADGFGGQAKTIAGGAVEATVQTGKRSASPFAWLVAAVTVVVFVLLKPERRDSLTRFADEAAVQAQELLRDLRGYDDEF